MLISLLVIIMVSLGGFALTYIYDDEDAPLLLRLSAGNIVGFALFSLVAFVLACFLGLSVSVVIAAILISLAPLGIFSQKAYRKKALATWAKANGKMQGFNGRKLLPFLYYAALFIIFCVFFERAMLAGEKGIFTSASQNYGDLPFHLGAIFSFTEGNNFPPENPSFSGAKFTYPFIADFIAACFVKLGASVKDAMYVQNITLAFSLLVIFERFAFKLTNNKLAGKVAPLLFLFCGGLGFLVFLRDYWNGPQSFLGLLFNLKRDYTINDQTFRWGNSLVVLFITQRSLLLGLPLTLIVLTKLWGLFQSEGKSGEGPNGGLSVRGLILIGLLAGTLPLIHVHSLAVLFLISAILFFYTLEKWNEWLTFASAVCTVAIPQLVWSLTGSASDLSKFIEWYFGWDKGDQNFFVFWLLNLGLFIPLVFISVFVLLQRSGKEDEDGKKGHFSAGHLIFYVPFLICFVVPNMIKLAPWQWDNIKVLVYWFVGSVPFVAWLLALLWERKAVFKAIAVACFFCLTLSGALDVWRTMTGVVSYQVFSSDAVRIAEEIKKKTDPKAMFLNAPTFNTAVVLSGRRSYMRYTGHLSSYGIDYQERENEVKRMYEGSAMAESLLRQKNIEYVMISSEEFSTLDEVDEDFFKKFPLIAQSGMYKVYKVR